MLMFAKSLLPTVVCFILMFGKRWLAPDVCSMFMFRKRCVHPDVFFGHNGYPSGRPVVLRGDRLVYLCLPPFAAG